MSDFRSYAVVAHGQQPYGDLPYAFHLARVEYIMEQLGVFGAAQSMDVYNFRAAAWLHDVIEDTTVTREEIKLDFNDRIADLVWAVTGEGTNRKERFASIHRKIEAYPDAAIVKLADRIANVKMSTKEGDKLKMYLKEQPLFEELIRPKVQPYQWRMLAKLFE